MSRLIPCAIESIDARLTGARSLLWHAMFPKG